MEERVKTALERAMERAEGLGKITSDELKRLEFLPLGNGIAARYLKEEELSLEAELAKTKGTGNRKWVVLGIQETLLSNIALPRDAASKHASKKAMEGITLIKENKRGVKATLSKIETLFGYYEQARLELLRELKKDFETRLAEAQRAMQYQIGGAAKVNAETQQQFQEEMRRAMGQLDMQYEKSLQEHKKELARLP